MNIAANLAARAGRRSLLPLVEESRRANRDPVVRGPLAARLEKIANGARPPVKGLSVPGNPHPVVPRAVPAAQAADHRERTVLVAQGPAVPRKSATKPRRPATDPLIPVNHPVVPKGVPNDPAPAPAALSARNGHMALAPAVREWNADRVKLPATDPSIPVNHPADISVAIAPVDHAMRTGPAKSARGVRSPAKGLLVPGSRMVVPRGVPNVPDPVPSDPAPVPVVHPVVVTGLAAHAPAVRENVAVQARDLVTGSPPLALMGVLPGPDHGPAVPVWIPAWTCLVVHEPRTIPERSSSGVKGLARDLSDPEGHPTTRMTNKRALASVPSGQAVHPARTNLAAQDLMRNGGHILLARNVSRPMASAYQSFVQKNMMMDIPAASPSPST